VLRRADRQHGVNVGQVGQPFTVAYVVTKFAVRSLAFSTTRAVAKRQNLGDCVAPRRVSTGFVTALRETPGCNDGTAKRTPTVSVREPDDIARTVMILLGDDASWITGQNIEVSGGAAHSWP